MIAHHTFTHRLTTLAQTLAAALSGFCLGVPVAHAGDDFMAAVTGGKPTFLARYRYETVDQENIARDAKASTLRTQLGYQTGDYKGFGAYLQFEDVRTVGTDDFNDTVNGKTQFPVVADPSSTEINQSYLSYAGLPSTLLRYGRQVINLDNQRFIGSVAFRQNEQTFDGLFFQNQSLPGTMVTLAHISNVNRIFSDNNPTLGNIRLNGEIANLSYAGFKPLKITGYGYFLDYAPGQSIATTLSNKTLGLRFDGAYPFSAFKLLYTAEYASQSDYKGGASTVDAKYLDAMLGVAVKGVQVKFNYEKLGGDGVYGFATPLATLHAFNGWADRFLATPKDGLKDAFVSVGGAHFGVNWLAVYHDFKSDNLAYDYGKEWDLSLAKKVMKNLTLSIQYAAYKGDKNATNVARNAPPAALAFDVNKLWLTAQYAF
jgi:hypothetical protein